MKNLVELLEEKLNNQNLKGDAAGLLTVNENIEFGNVQFKLVGNNAQDGSFLGNVKFKYSDKEDTFSINELIDKLEKLELIEKRISKIEKLKPITLEEITKKVDKETEEQRQENGEQKKEEESVLNVKAYNEKLQGYIKALKGIIDAINSIPEDEKLNNKIKELEENENNCKIKVGEIWKQLGENSELDDNLETQLENIKQRVDYLKKAKEEAEAKKNALEGTIKGLNIKVTQAGKDLTTAQENLDAANAKAEEEKKKADAKQKELETAQKNLNNANAARNTAEEKLKTANSRAKKLGVVASLGWIGAFVSLGCVFQNELRNACSTVCKKVSELKNSILG